MASNVIGFNDYWSRYGNSPIGYDEMIAQNPGLSRDLIDLYALVGHGLYGSANNLLGDKTQGAYDPMASAYWGRVKAQGLDPMTLIFGTNNPQAAYDAYMAKQNAGTILPGQTGYRAPATGAPVTSSDPNAYVYPTGLSLPPAAARPDLTDNRLAALENVMPGFAEWLKNNPLSMPGQDPAVNRLAPAGGVTRNPVRPTTPLVPPGRLTAYQARTNPYVNAFVRPFVDNTQSGLGAQRTSGYGGRNDAYSNRLALPYNPTGIR